MAVFHTSFCPRPQDPSSPGHAAASPTCFILASSLLVCSSCLRSFLFPTRMMGTLGQKCFTSGVHFSGIFSADTPKDVVVGTVRQKPSLPQLSPGLLNTRYPCTPPSPLWWMPSPPPQGLLSPSQRRPAGPYTPSPQPLKMADTKGSPSLLRSLTQAIRTVNGETHEDDVSVRVGQRPEAIVVFLPCRVPQRQLHLTHRTTE